jgi:hypothetical protein
MPAPGPILEHDPLAVIASHLDHLAANGVLELALQRALRGFVAGDEAFSFLCEGHLIPLVVARTKQIPDPFQNRLSSLQSGQGAAKDIPRRLGNRYQIVLVRSFAMPFRWCGFYCFGHNLNRYFRTFLAAFYLLAGQDYHRNMLPGVVGWQ